jgi:exonuclease SbcD
VRLLFFADLHLDAPFAWARPEVARARRHSIRECLRRICDLAAAERVDALCCGGDLYEQERFTPDTAAYLRDAFARLHPLPVFLAPGNHDWLGPASLYRQVSWTDNVHVYGQARLAPVELTDGFTLWGAAHQQPANTANFLDGFQVDRGGINIGLFHGSEQGDFAAQDRGKVAHAPFHADQVAAAGLTHALVGHFHTPRDAPTYTYPGNPEPLTFGETGERGPVLVTIDDAGGVRRQRHRVAVAQVTDVTVDLSGVAHSDEVRDRVRARLDGMVGTVRVTLVGEVGLDVEVTLADLDGVAPQVDVVPRLGHLSVSYDLDAIAEERTVRGLFVRDVRAAPDLTDDQRRRVLITGLRALDERRAEDLEVR